jgi:hypothetical protein
MHVLPLISQILYSPLGLGIPGSSKPIALIFRRRQAGIRGALLRTLGRDVICLKAAASMPQEAWGEHAIIDYRIVT